MYLQLQYPRKALCRSYGEIELSLCVACNVCEKLLGADLADIQADMQCRT